MSYCVYCHTNKSNGKKYFGITSQGVKRRWNNGHGYKSNKYFSSAIAKNGWDNFSHEIIVSGIDKESAIELEKSLIALYDTTDRKNGYNISDGGELGFLGHQKPMTDETRAKIGKALRESELFKANRVTWNKGKHYTEEQKSKYLNAWNFTSEDTRQKISNSVKDLWKDDSYRRNMRESHIGKGTRGVVCIETGETFSSLKSAQEKTSIRYEGISKACSGKQETAGGFHWEYTQ